jgi:AcrR family transcriptional regulator
MAQPAQKQAKRRRRPPQAPPGAAAPTQKPSQRERLLDAMIELSAHSGHQHVSIAEVSSRAGVSSATFYEQFENKEACLLAAYAAAAERLLALAPPMPAGRGWTDAANDSLDRLARALQRDPIAGRLLFVETLAGSPQMRDTRRIVLGAFEDRAREFLDSKPTGDDILDVPPIALIGAFRSVVARHLHAHAEDVLPSLSRDGVAWVRSYAVAADRERWSTGPNALLPGAPGQEEPPPAPRHLARLPRGRHGLPAGVVKRSQRMRILHATAEVTLSKGYGGATVAEIVSAAGIGRDIFYEHFADKRDAFLEAQQYPTQHILDRFAASYFSGRHWPERMWNALATLVRQIAENPALSHLRLIGCYEAGPEAIRRAEDITRSFTIFFEEGYGYRPEARDLPHLYSEVVTGAIFEVIQRHVAHGDLIGLRRCLPQLTYIAIAPFTGAEAAIDLVSSLIERCPRGEPALAA